MKNFTANPFFFLLFTVGCISTDVDLRTGIEIDFSKDVGKYQPFTQYINSSIRKAPPLEFAGMVKEDMGKIKITRCWLMLDNMWDYRTNEYDFNFKIGQYKFEGDGDKFPYNWDKVEESPYYFEDHLTSFCDISQEVLLVINRYHKEVIDGTISIQEWQEVIKNSIIHYLQICPNLKYIEVLNETAIDHFGGLSDEQYYMFYKASYEVVNFINNAGIPSTPLKIGGPTSTGLGLTYSKIDHNNSQAEEHNKLEKVYIFLKNFKNDKNPSKKLDFISFHEYHIGTRSPAGMSKYQGIIDNLLSKFSLDSDISIFIDEAGINPASSSANHSMGILTMDNYLKNSEKVKLFPWVIYHTDSQAKWVMYNGKLKKTTFGLVGVMANWHNDREVYGRSFEADKDGFGVHVIATKGDNEYCFQLWNYSDEQKEVIVNIDGLPHQASGLDQTKYFINTTSDTNEELQIDESPIELEAIENTTQNSLKVVIEPYTTYFYKFKEMD